VTEACTKMPPGGPVESPHFVRCGSCGATTPAIATELAPAMARITTGSSTLCSRYPMTAPAATDNVQEKCMAVGKSSGSLKAHSMQLNLGKLNGGGAKPAADASNAVPFSPRSWEVASYYYRFVQQSPRFYELTPRQDAHESMPSSSVLSAAPTPKKNLMCVLKATPGIFCLCSLV
jgi:hypothetical protein